MATKAPKKAADTAMVAAKASNIVSIQDMLRKQAEAVSEQVAPPSGVAIRITQDKHFLLPDGQKTQGPLELVIVDFVSTNKYYEGVYDAKNISPPACFAIGRIPTQLVPSAKSPNKQSDSCTTCPQAQFGPNNEAKPCKNTRTLAVLPPDADESTPVWLLNVSPTALKAFDGYVSAVARALAVPPVGVVTTVDFDPGVTYAKLRFSDPRPNERVEGMLARQEEARKLLMTEPDVSGYQAPKKVAVRRR